MTPMQAMFLARLLRSIKGRPLTEREVDDAVMAFRLGKVATQALREAAGVEDE